MHGGFGLRHTGGGGGGGGCFGGGGGGESDQAESDGGAGGGGGSTCVDPSLTDVSYANGLASGDDGTAVITYTVPHPVITSPDLAGFTVGAARTYTITATGFPPPTITLEGPLPAGLRFISSPGVGTIVGTATGAPGTYLVTVHAHNENQPDAVQTLRIVVRPRSVQGPTPPAASVAPPQAGKSIVVAPVSGTVLVKVPGGTFVPISTLTNIPVASIVDVRRGRVSLTSAGDRHGGTQTGVFYGGLFRVDQDKSAKPITQATLRGAVGPCPRARKTGASKKKARRGLWGNGKGRFRTRGNNSTATVRGTWWYVEDRLSPGCTPRSRRWTRTSSRT